MAVLAGLGMEGIPTQTQLCVLTDERFETIRALAADAKVTRDRLADEQRKELDRLREVERLATAEREAREAGERAEADRAEADRSARETEEREAKARPEREKLAAWGREVLIAIPEVPEVKDPRNVAILASATVGIQNALRAMRDALGDVTAE